MTVISASMFAETEELTTVRIHNNITSIEKKAFYYAGSLKEIIFAGTKAEWNAIPQGAQVFEGAGRNVSGGCIIYCNNGNIAQSST
jgi:hypothetical protein